MKCLWLGRLARPDIIKPIGDLATQVQRWSRNCDRMLHRLVCYIHSSLQHRLVGAVGDLPDDVRLRLYVDADFAGDRLDAKSTSGGFLVLYGENTFFPLSWICKKQTAVSRSTTEAEVISLAYSLFAEALPTLQLWCTLLGREVDLEVLEDNEATIKIVKKKGSAKLRHVTRTHRVNLASTYDVFEDPHVDIMYVNTKEQAADIFTKALPPQSWDHALRLMGLLQAAGESGDHLAGAVNAAGSCAVARPAECAAPGVAIPPGHSEQPVGLEGWACKVAVPRGLYRHGRGELKKYGPLGRSPYPVGPSLGTPNREPPFNKVESCFRNYLA